MKTYGEVEV